MAPDKGICIYPGGLLAAGSCPACWVAAFTGFETPILQEVFSGSGGGEGDCKAVAKWGTYFGVET